MKSRKNHTYLLSHLYILFSIVVLPLVFVQCSDLVFDDSEQERNRSTQERNFAGSTPTLPGGALYEIVLPDQWTDLFVYAHGYVNPQEPLAIPDDNIGGQAVSDIVTQLGFAYATTSYRANGLVGPEAVQDVLELVETFIDLHGMPRHIYLVGVSEGALVTTLGVEQHAETFSGGLAACGPVGNFKKQLTYLGDFHVLFNYFFPNLLGGDPSGVPDGVVNDWLPENSPLRQQVAQAINSNPQKARTLLKVAQVPVENESDVDELETTIFSLLRYNILATNNAVDRLGGQPFDNRKRYYFGSGSFFKDLRINRKIARLTADPAALAVVKNQFETTGDLERPLVMTHTTGDQEIPYWHELLYRLKAFSEGSSLLHSNIPVTQRFGHCNFELNELLTSFGLLVLKVSLQDLFVPNTLFESDLQRQDFLEMSRKQGLNPVIIQTESPIQ